jgi:flavin-dependent dehydrogenase
LYFCPDLKGYGWCIRKDRFLNVGLGIEQAHGLSGALAGFCAFLKERGRIPQDIPARFHGHAYLLHGHARRALMDAGVLVVGDAAGLAWPRSGEGIRPAVESGLMAAATALEAGRDYRRQFLAGYRQRIQARYGPATADGRDRSSPALRRRVAPWLLRSRGFTRRILLDRWFLQTHLADYQVD